MSYNGSTPASHAGSVGSIPITRSNDKRDQGAQVFETLKQLCKIFLAFVMAGVISIIGLITLVDPNQFKDYIRKQIALSTGRTLTINGPIYWYLDPGLSIEIYDLSLGNAPNFSSEFFTVKKARFETKLWTLLSGKIFVDVHLQGLQLNLTRNIAGVSNWADLQQIFLEKKSSKKPFVLPYSVTLEDASLNWHDASLDRQIKISQFNLVAKKLPVAIAGFPIPITSKFYLEDPSQNHVGNLALNAEWCFNEKQQLAIQNLKLTANLQDFRPLVLTGELAIQDFKNTPLIQGKFQGANIDLSQWLTEFNLPLYPLMSPNAELKTAFNYRAPSLEVTSLLLSLENKGSLEASFKTDLRNKMFRTLTINGSFHGKKLRVAGLPITEISSTVEAKDGLFNFEDFNIQFANSQHQGKLKVDLRNPIPKFQISDQLYSPDINELLALIGEKDKITGKIQANASFTTQGSNFKECLQNLFGNAYITLIDGKVRGIELPPLLQHMQTTVVMLTDTLAKKQPINVAAVLTAELGEWKQQAINYQQLTSPFHTIEAHISVEDGKMHTSDFKLMHSDYTVNGQGTFDFVNKNAEYQALALLAQAPSLSSQSLLAFLKKTPLSIQIQGPFNNLSVRPNLAHYAESAIKLVQKPHTENSNDNTLEKLFGF